MNKIIKTPSGAVYRVVQRTSEDGTHPYEEIEAVDDLATRTGVTKNIKIPQEVMERAEAAVASLSIQFPDFAKAEIERLRMLAKALSGAASIDAKQQEADAIFHISHDLKGMGGSFGFPLVTRVAMSLCRLIRQAAHLDTQICAATVVHVDTLLLVLNQTIDDPDYPEALRLVAEIEALTLYLVGPDTDD